MKAPRPMTDTDFSLLIEGRVKDNGKNPFFGFAPGKKNPQIIAQFLTKDNKRFSQPMMSWLSLFSMLDSMEAVVLHPGTEKISRTFEIMRTASGGREVPSGTKLTISRRADGLVSVRLENAEIREAIFPMILSRGHREETRTESGEPIDPREKYIRDPITYINMIRSAAKLWKHEITHRGNEEMREQLRDSSNWG